MTATSAANSPSRGRIIAARILLVLGVLLLVVSILSTYVKREALDSGQFRQTSQQLIADPAIQEAVAAQMTDALANVDFTDSLEAKLPTNLQALASPIAGLAQGFVGTAAENLLARPRIQDAFVEARRALAKQFVKVLHGDTQAVDTSNGDVVLDIRPLVLKLGDRFGFVTDLASPDPAGRRAGHDPRGRQSGHGPEDHPLARADRELRLDLRARRLRRRHLVGPRAPAAGGSLARHRSRRRRPDRARRALARRQVRRRSTRRHRFDAAGGPQRVADHHAVARRGRLGRALVGILVAIGAWLVGPGDRATAARGLRSPRTCGGRRSRGARSSSGCCCIIWLLPIEVFRTTAVLVVASAIGFVIFLRQLAAESPAPAPSASRATRSATGRRPG